MSVRRRLVEAQDNGQVSREEMREAFLDFEAQLAVSGGVVSVISTREPTGFPGEMVTTSAVFEWKDRTDAKEQPEQRLHILTDAEVQGLVAAATPDPPAAAGAAPAVEPELEVEALEAQREEPEIDESSVPAEMR